MQSDSSSTTAGKSTISKSCVCWDAIRSAGGHIAIRDNLLTEAPGLFILSGNVGTFNVIVITISGSKGTATGHLPPVVSPVVSVEDD
jgi:hypothetical protein